MPVVDQVDVDGALACSLVAVEVAEHGFAQPVDPVRVAAMLGLDGAEHADAVAVAASLRGLRDAAVGIGRRSLAAPGTTPTSPGCAGLPVPRRPSTTWQQLRNARPGRRRGAAGGRPNGRARRGRRLGGRPRRRTVDVVADGEDHCVVAGAGDLLTAAVAHLLDIPRGAAEWAERGPSSRLEGPHVLVGEDGERRFAETPVPSDAVGALVVPGPAGLLPFHRRLAPGEWRMLRQHLKRAVIGDNVARATSGIPFGVDVLVVGGPAGDAELLDLVVRAVRGATPGRADVAGVLGHRWAVAYGLTLLDARGDSTTIP